MDGIRCDHKEFLDRQNMEDNLTVPERINEEKTIEPRSRSYPNAVQFEDPSASIANTPSPFARTCQVW
jgi:hypothetical protein